MNSLEQYGTLLSKAANEDGRDIYRFIVNTDIINRNGWKTISEGISTTDFLKSPVFLFAHDDYDYPIGKVTGFELKKARHAGKQLIANVWFHEESEESKLAKKLVDLGVLTSTSIRISPLEKGEPIKITEQLRKTLPRHIERVEVYTKSDLREVSLVTVPANTGARINEKIKNAYAENQLSEQEYTLAASLIQEDEENKDTSINNDLITKKGTDMSFEIENVGLKKDVEILQASNKAFEADKKSLEEKLTSASDALEKLKTLSAATTAELNAAKESLVAKEAEHARLQKQNFDIEEKMYCDKLQRDGKLPPNEVDDTIADLVKMRQLADSDKEDSFYQRTRARLEKRTAIISGGEKIAGAMAKPGTFTIRDIENSSETAAAFVEWIDTLSAKENKPWQEIKDRELARYKGGA